MQYVNITENNHFDIKKPSRLQTAACHSGSGSFLKQLDGEAWITITFASRFFNTREMKCSTNELKLLRVVWATDYFQSYLYGSEFEIVTDHKALLSAINANHGNKTMGSKLTRWVNRLLPFNFNFRHLRRKEMGFTNLLSRLPSGRALPSSHYANEFVFATFNKITDSLSINTMCTKKKCKKTARHQIIKWTLIMYII